MQVKLASGLKLILLHALTVNCVYYASGSNGGS